MGIARTAGVDDALTSNADPDLRLRAPVPVKA